jgi:hypothetical protein
VAIAAHAACASTAVTSGHTSGSKASESSCSAIWGGTSVATCQSTLDTIGSIAIR